MATYELKADCFIDGQYKKSGAIVKVSNDIIPSMYWQPVDDEARKCVEKRNKENEGVRKILNHTPTLKAPHTTPRAILEANKDFISDKPKQTRTRQRQSQKDNLEDVPFDNNPSGLEVLEASFLSQDSNDDNCFDSD